MNLLRSSLILLLLLTSCASPPARPWTGEWWVGSSQDQSVKTKTETLKCNEPEFDEYVCLPFSEYQDLMLSIQQMKY